MNPAAELFSQVIDHYFIVKRDGDDLILEPTPFSKKLPDSLVQSLKNHKPELLSLLRFQEEADALLLESTRRLAKAWPKGCPLDTAEWERLEAELHRAYWSLDTGRLKAILELREKLALKLFEAHQKGAAA